MNDYIEIDISGDTKLFIQTNSAEKNGTGTRKMRDVSYKNNKILKATKAQFEQSLDAVKYVGQSLSEKFKDLQPDNVEIEFGITLSAEANVIISSISTEANFKVKLTWKDETK